MFMNEMSVNHQRPKDLIRSVAAFTPFLRLRKMRAEIRMSQVKGSGIVRENVVDSPVFRPVFLDHLAA
jgi:hypothetical protein